MFNVGWKKVWPDVVEDGNSRLPLEHEYSRITKLVHIMEVGFEDLAEADIVELTEGKN